MTQMVWSIGQVALFAVGIMTTPVLGQDLFGLRGEAELRNSALLQAADQGKAQQPSWHYGGFIDLGYSLNFNFPANHLFRDPSTTPRVNELDINMAGAYVQKDPFEQSRWGTELLVQGGMDAKDYGFGVNLPKVQGSDALRHFDRANVSYLAPAGNGLTVQAELFNSLIGYESLYAKDNVTYTRAWIADYSPYLMFGANAVSPSTTNGLRRCSRSTNTSISKTRTIFRVMGRKWPTNPVDSGPLRKRSITGPINRTPHWSFGDPSRTPSWDGR